MFLVMRNGIIAKTNMIIYDTFWGPSILQKQ